MAFALYTLLTLLALDVASRSLLRISWRDRLVLLLLPLVEAGEALLRSRVLGAIDLAWTREPLASMRVASGVELQSPIVFYDQWCLLVPWRQAVRAALAAGEWPLWNPFVLSGEPLLAAASPAVFHPIHLASLLLPLPQAITFVAAATLGLAALSMYLLARDIGVRAEVGLFAGAAWSYGAFHLFWLGWPHALAVSAVPLLVLATRRAVREPGSISVATMGVSWMLLILGGSPQVALPAGLLAGLLFLGELLVTRGRRRALLCASAGTLLGLSLSAVQLVPFLTALPQASVLAMRENGDGAGLIATDAATSLSLLTEHVLPFALGLDPAGVRVRRQLDLARATTWIGSVGLAAAIYGFAAGRSRWRWPLAGAISCGIALSIFLPVAIVVAKALPGFALMRPRYGVVWSSFAITLLAALGLEAALRESARRGFLLACLAGASVIGGALALAAPHLSERGVEPGEALALSLAALIPLAFVALAVSLRSSATVVVVLALGGLLVERQVEMGGYNRSFPVEQFYPAIAPLDELAHRREEGRFVAVGRAALHPNTATMWGLEDVRGNDPMALQRLVETYPIWAPGSPYQISRLATLHPFLSFLNVRFALASGPVELLPGWRLVRQGPGWFLYENGSLLPRVFSPAKIRTGGSSAERLADLGARTDFGALAWIESDAAPDAPAVLDNGPCAVETERRGQALRIVADCERSAWLATSTPAWLGWRASAGELVLPIGIVNHAFVAIHVPAGSHTIDLQYRPRSFYFGAILSLAALAILAVLIWRGSTGIRPDLTIRSPA